MAKKITIFAIIVFASSLLGAAACWLFFSVAEAFSPFLDGLSGLAYVGFIVIGFISSFLSSLYLAWRIVSKKPYNLYHYFFIAILPTPIAATPFGLVFFEKWDWAGGAIAISTFDIIAYVFTSITISSALVLQLLKLIFHRSPFALKSSKVLP